MKIASSRQGSRAATLLPAGIALLSLAVVISADPSPGPFIDFKFDKLAEKAPPLLRRLLTPPGRKLGAEKRSGPAEAEVVVDESVQPAPVSNSTENSTQGRNEEDGEKISDELGVDAADKTVADDQTSTSKHELLTTATEDDDGSWTGRLLRQGRQLATNLLSLSNLAPLGIPFGILVDTVNQKVTVDTTALICSLIVIFVPIILGWLMIVYAWIIFSMVEFDYSVFGQFPRPLPTAAASRMDILQGALKMFRMAYNHYMNANEDPPVDAVAADPDALPENEFLKEYLRNPDFDPLAPGGKLAEQYFDVDDNEIRRRSRN